jgi:hypothetical protein
MAIKIGKLLSANTMVGTGDDDTLIGGLFNDVFIGSAGADKINGGLGGIDTVDYSASTAGVTVDLGLGKGSGGDAEGDTLFSIEKAIGSAYADKLIGSSGNDTFMGGGGKDVFVMTPGNDTITDFTAPTLVIDFEGVPLAAGGGSVPSGYLGLNWEGFSAGKFNAGDFVPLRDFADDSLGFNKAGVTKMSFSSPSSDFDLGAFSIGGKDFVVGLNAYDDGVLVGTGTAYINGSGFFEYSSSDGFIDSGGAISSMGIIIGGRFTSIDKLEFVKAGANDFAVDDIKLAIEDSDKIDVPDGTNIAALVASAASDGHGGTLLTIPATYVVRDGRTSEVSPASTLDLLGVDPTSVKADWFI